MPTSRLKVTSVKFRVQTVQNRRIKLSSDRLDLDLLDDLFGKTIRQETARQRRIDATALEIENLVRFQLTDSGAMCALHVIGKNLKLRLRVHLGFVRQQQILVSLLRVGQLRAMTHKNFAVEDRPRLAVENAFVKLMTGAVRLPVINHRMRVGVLVAVNHI